MFRECGDVERVGDVAPGGIMSLQNVLLPEERFDQVRF